MGSRFLFLQLLPDSLIGHGALQAVFEQGRDQRIALDQRNRAPELREHEGVAPQPGGGIDDARPNSGQQADRLGDHLPRAAAKQAPVRHGTSDEIDTHRPRRIVGEVDELQSIRPELQREFRFAGKRQMQAFSPRSRRSVERRVKRLDANARRWL